MGVKNGVFRHALKNGSNDLVHSLSEERYYDLTYVCQISCSQKLWFSRYGGKRGQKWGFSDFSEKVMHKIGSFS